MLDIFLLPYSCSWALENTPSLELTLNLLGIDFEPEAQSSININGTKRSSLGSTVILCNAGKPSAGQKEQSCSKIGGTTLKSRSWFCIFACVYDL